MLLACSADQEQAQKLALSKKSFIVQTLVVQLKIQLHKLFKLHKLQMLLHHYQFLYKH